MPFDLAQFIRIKGMIDAVLVKSPPDPLTATPALLQTYQRARDLCSEMVAGTDEEAEFERVSRS